VIIALGEGVICTIASLSAVVGPEGPGWSVDAAAVALAGIGLTFGMWWIYFVIPSGDALHAHRDRAFGWGYGHIPLIGAVVATGGGLHVAAYHLEEESVLSASATVLTVVIPVAAYFLSVFVLYGYLTRSFDPFHLTMIAVTAVVLAAPLLLASAGASMAWCLVVLSLSPWVTVLGYELHSYRHNAEVIERLSRV
jgi:low temperature requirement protein LtrA